MSRWLILALLPLAGCVDAPAACDPPEEADASREPYDHGVVLYTVLHGSPDDYVVDAWACNEDDAPRYLLEREGECVGSWTWTLQAPGDDAATHGWPSDGHYGDCGFQSLAPGYAATQRLSIPKEEATSGSEWRIRLQVYTQPEIITGAGGGPVHAVYTL